jgi:hypothetical protein
MLIVSLPLTAEARVLSLLKKLWVLPVDIRLSAHSNQLRSGRAPIPSSARCRCSTSSTSRSTTGIRSPSAPSTSSFSLIGIIVFSPIMLATADRHQARQQGPGDLQAEAPRLQQRDHRGLQVPLDVHGDAGSDGTQGGDQGRPARYPSRPLHPQDLDRRTAAVLQRAVRLLSLVGPRPHAVAAQSHNKLYHEVVDGYFARHRVKPGVTGWAQINGWRGEIDTDEKIKMRTEYDLYYIENWSLWFDLKILFLTPIRLLNTENAY